MSRGERHRRRAQSLVRGSRHLIQQIAFPTCCGNRPIDLIWVHGGGANTQTRYQSTRWAYRVVYSSLRREIKVCGEPPTVMGLVITIVPFHR